MSIVGRRQTDSALPQPRLDAELSQLQRRKTDGDQRARPRANSVVSSVRGKTSFVRAATVRQDDVPRGPRIPSSASRSPGEAWSRAAIREKLRPLLTSTADWAADFQSLPDGADGAPASGAQEREKKKLQAAADQLSQLYASLHTPAEFALVMDELNAAVKGKSAYLDPVTVRKIIAHLPLRDQLPMLHSGSDDYGRPVRAIYITRLTRICLMGTPEGIQRLATYDKAAKAARKAAPPPRAIAVAPEQALPQPEIPQAFKETVPTQEAFAENIIGRKPRRDIALFGITLVARDTAYKGVLKNLEGYRLAVQSVPSTVSPDWFDIRRVNLALDKLVASLQKCMDKESQPHRAAIGKQLLHYQAEHAMLQEVIAEIRKADKPGGDDLATVRARQRMIEASLVSLYKLPPVLALECATAPGGKLDKKPMGQGTVHTVHKATVQLRSGALFTGVYKQEVAGQDLPAVAEDSGISAEHPNWSVRNLATWKLCERLKLRVALPTYLVAGRNEFGSIMAVAAGDPPLTQGGDRTFKVDENLARRLAGDPAKLTRFGQDSGFKGARIDGETVTMIGTIYESSIGEDGNGKAVVVVYPQKAMSIAKVDFSNPQLRRELTRLQWLDALTGQCDRHAQNYFIRCDEKGIYTVESFDHDNSFGRLLRNPNEPIGKNKNMARLPKVIDTETASELLALANEPELLEQYCNGLTAEEISATKDRLRAIKAQIESFADPSKGRMDATHGKVLSSVDEWGSNEVSELLGVESMDALTKGPQGMSKLVSQLLDRTAASSYVARETAALDGATLSTTKLHFSQAALFDPQALTAQLHDTFPLDDVPEAP